MSVFSAKTGLSSILKTYSPAEREKSKQTLINKVRFELPKEKGIVRVVKDAINQNNFQFIPEYIDFLKECDLSDQEYFTIIGDAHAVAVHFMNPNLATLGETLLSLPWTKRPTHCAKAFSEFCLDLMISQSRYITFGIPKLIDVWIPKELEDFMWTNGFPNESVKNELYAVHKLIDRLLTVIPMTFEVILGTIEAKFPYHKKPQHVIAGYIYNILWLLEYKPMCMHYLMQVLFQKLILLDVNAPRNEIEDSEYEEDEMKDDEQMFKMEDDSNKDYVEEITPIKHPVAHTLDVCMEVVFDFFDKHLFSGGDINLRNEKFNTVLSAFDFALLPTHNTHHVQFLMFYICNTKMFYADKFLKSLWNKIIEPNNSTVIRQAAVGYLASFLARSKPLPIKVIKHYLEELCSWAHKYIQRSDQSRSDGTVKANIVFFSICQAIFYVIAFRSRQLTEGNKDLRDLQSLHLSALVTCNLNPLRVCLPAVATAFAGVTRTYQLAYCHAILERNARRRLATVYAHDISTPEETIDTFFPFDPYMLKLSNKRITKCYLQYQANEAEEEPLSAENVRKHNSSEMIEDVDDFLIADKRQKISDLAKSAERETQFMYGLSPGFHK